MIRIIEDDVDKVRPFGVLLHLPSDASPGQDGVAAWADLAPFDLDGDPPEIGLAFVGRRGLTVDRLERHERTCELLIPATGDIVVAVSPRTTAGVPTRCDAAVRIHLGQALMLAPGVWHSVAYPVSDTAAYWWVFRRGTGASDLAFADIADPEPLRLSS